MSGNKCFVCTGEIQNGTSGGDNSSSEENSILLCKILELPDLEGNETNKFGEREVSYCRLCLNKILNIRDMLEELERLEKKVLDEKYSIELQLKDKDKSQGQNSSGDQLRGDIVKELRVASIGSMLDKIRKKRVGQRRNARGSHHVRIMESVTIPNIVYEATVQPISSDDVQIGINVFALEDSQSQLVDKHSFLPNSQSLMMTRSDDSGTELEDMANQEPLTANISETSCVFQDEECDIKYEMRSDEDMTTDPLHSALDQLDFQQNALIPETSAKLEVDDLPNVTSFSDAQQTTSTTNEHKDPPSHKNFICGTCGALFVSYNQLRIHDDRVHMNGVNGRSTVKNNRRKGGKSRQKKNLAPCLRPKKCEECGKVLSTKKTWTEHVMAFHRGQYKYKCTLCNYGSQRSHRLHRHMSMHSRQYAMMS